MLSVQEIANLVAHKLAKECTPEPFVWVDDPSSVTPLLILFFFSEQCYSYVQVLQKSYVLV